VLVDIVVDASIARAAGEESATFPDSKNARDCLKCILANKHSLVSSPELWAEWRKHQSRFASLWLTRMHARRLVRRIQSPFDQNLRGRIEAATVSRKEWIQLEKDCILVEAALVTDKIILSLDDAARNLFRQSSAKVGELRSIHWANPCRAEEQAADWIASGCFAAHRRTLGFEQSER
jgi:hypothetical protein